jgi:hypothetical protein
MGSNRTVCRARRLRWSAFVASIAMRQRSDGTSAGIGTALDRARPSKTIARAPH